MAKIAILPLRGNSKPKDGRSLDALVQLGAGSKNSDKGVDSASVVHTKETLRHFSRKDRGSYEQRASFLYRHYRWRNLSLATGIENSSLLSDLQNDIDAAVTSGAVSCLVKPNSNGYPVNHYNVLTEDKGEAAYLEKAIKNRTTLVNTISGLRYCCKSAVVGSDGELGHVVATSNSCKSQHCCICARRKGAKYGARLFAAMEDTDNSHHFDGRYFYFVTLTLRHNEATRTGVYLDELSKCMTKLFRSKFWKELTEEGGWLSHIETTMNDGKFHIHSHILVCCDRITKPVKIIQSDLSRKWEKITGDSYVAAWDLIKGRKVNGKFEKFDKGCKKSIQGAVLELFKYSTKVGAIGKLNPSDFDGFSNFVAWTKGKKFIRAGGFMKGLEITSAKSKYDTPAPDGELGYDLYFGLAATNIKFNKNPCRDYSKRSRDRVSNEVYLDSISNYEEIPEETIGWYFSEDPNKGSLMDYLERNFSFVSGPDGELDSVELTDSEAVEAIERMRQLSLFSDFGSD